MNIKVYWISGSAPAWRVLLTLAIKKLPYESHILQTSQKEQKQPWFLEMNPRGQIPLLQDGDTLICESLAIMHYLENQYSDVSLFGNSAKQTAKIEQSLHEVLQYTDSTVTELVQPVFRNKVSEKLQELPGIAQDIKKELQILENKLEDSDWLVGGFSAADIVLIPTMQRLLRAIGKRKEVASEIGLGNLSQMYPNLDLWNQRTQSLPAFESTFPPHWR